MKRRLIAGTINHYMAERGWENVHLDASARPLAGSGKPPEIVADIADLSAIPDASFDEVRCWHTLEHLRRPDARRALVEFHRILKPQGVVDVETPDLEWIAGQLAEGNVSFPDFCQNVYGEQLDIEDAAFMCHRWGYSPQTLEELVADAGFEVERCETGGLRYRGVKR